MFPKPIGPIMLYLFSCLCIYFTTLRTLKFMPSTRISTWQALRIDLSVTQSLICPFDC